MRFHVPRSMALALAAAVTLTSLDLAPAYAVASKDQQAIQNTSTDFSARRRRHYGNRAALGAVIGMFGTIAAIAAVLSLSLFRRALLRGPVLRVRMGRRLPPLWWPRRPSPSPALTKFVSRACSLTDSGP